jgi:hypothetical protein
MRRSIESAQRKVRQIAITISADGTTVTGLDALQVSVTDTGTGDKLITFNEAFAAAPHVMVTVGTDESIARIGTVSASSAQILTDDATDGTTAKDAITHVLIIGSDITDRY